MMQLKLLSSIALLLFFFADASAQDWRTISALADSQNASGHYDSAIVLGREALTLAEKMYEPTDTLIAGLYERLAHYMLRRGGRFREAAGLYQSALSIREKALGSADTSLLPLLYQLGLSHYQSSEFLEAENVFKRLIRLTETVFGPGSLELAKPLQILGALYKTTGRYAESETAQRLSLDTRVAHLGTDHPETAGNLQNLSVLYSDLGRFTEAESLTVKSFRLFVKTYGYESGHIFGSLHNLGEIYHQEGRILRAKETFLESLRMKEKFQGPTSTWTISTLTSLGVVYGELGMPDSAEHFFRRALAALDHNYGQRSSSSVSTLQKLGTLIHQQGQYAQAESLLILSRRIGEDSWGTDHPSVSISLLLLANVYRDLEQYRTADSLYQQALSIRTALLGEDTPLHAECYEELGRSALLQKNARTGFANLVKAFRIGRETFFRRSSILSEKDALSLSGRLHDTAGKVFSAFFLLERPTQQDTIQMAEVALSLKSGNTDVALERSRWLLRNKDPGLDRLTDQYRTTQSLLSKSFVSNSTQSPLARRFLTDSLVTRCDSLERELVRQSGSVIRESMYRDSVVQKILAAMPARVTLVEFVRWNPTTPYSTDSTSRFLALVIDSASVKTVVDIGSTKPIDDLVTQYRQLFPRLGAHVVTYDQRQSDILSNTLLGKIWRPFEHHLPVRNSVFVAPDGGLNLISLGGLRYNDGRYLIERHPLHYLSAGRDMIRFGQDTTSSGESLLALGDPDFDATPRQRLSGESALALQAVHSEDNAPRNVRTGCEALSDMKVDRLPNTRAEVAAIGKAFPLSDVFEGSSASEETFKTMAHGRKAIHLATHGYYLQASCGEQTPSPVSENPLLQSGLLLAGANLHGEGAREAGAEDGILTALEVSAMDLRGTDLVVLSACETGLGKVEQGEGVYGLRRAFQMAGAKTVVSSLWKVPDRQTMQFMKTLYSTKAKTYPELMQQVALKHIREARLRGRPTHPFTWGAFVATGDWRVR